MFQIRRFFRVYLNKDYVKYGTPRRVHFWHHGHNLNKLGRGPLGYATYQILRL